MAQALLFINGDLLNRKVTADGGLVDQLVKAGKSDDAILEELYWTAFGRGPRPQERASDLTAITKAIASQPADTAATTAANVKSSAGTAAPTRNDVARRKAFEDMLWVLVNSKEFLFNH